MAISNCVKCGNHFFEMKEAEPATSNFKVQLIQCSSCGGVVGVMDYYNIGQLIHDFANKMNAKL
jgi:hypothetical protein